MSRSWNSIMGAVLIPDSLRRGKNKRNFHNIFIFSVPSAWDNRYRIVLVIALICHRMFLVALSTSNPVIASAVQKSAPRFERQRAHERTTARIERDDGRPG